MEGFTKRKWMAITLAAVILPISLLTTFKLVGIIPEPQTPETTTLKAISWEMERPTYSIGIGERIENAYSDGKLEARVSVGILAYGEKYPIGVFFDADSLILEVLVNLTIAQGFVSSVTITYSPTNENSTIFVGSNDWELTQLNVTVTRMENIGTDRNKAYVVAKVSNSPAYLKTQLYWAFNNYEFQEHQLDLIIEILYFNGTTYLKMVAPIILRVWPDVGNSFETAREIVPGVYNGSVYWDDCEDYYSFWAKTGENINAKMTFPDCSDYDLYLYNPHKELMAFSCLRESGVTEQIIFQANSTGLWFIRIKCFSAVQIRGLYSLRFVISNNENG